MNWRSITLFWKNTELRNRLFVVLGILVAYAALTLVPAPVPDTQKLQEFLNSFFARSPLLGFANLFTGGALGQFSIIAMGIGPYITASIVVQLMQQVIPSWESLAKEGQAGQRKLNQYTRFLTVPMAVIQSFAVIALVRTLSTQSTGTDLIGNPTLGQWAIMILTMVAGSMFLMWLGELITEKGYGNGQSLIIAAGIVASMPGLFAQQFSLIQSDPTQLSKLFILVGVGLITVIGVVFLNEAQRNIPVSYARRQAARSTYNSVDTHLPLKLITGGVIPVIFALAILSAPTFIGQLFANASTEWLAKFANNLTVWFANTSTVYAVTYFLLIFVSTYLYTSVVFKPKDISENLQKQGGFIPGIRPGKETATYLKTVIRRLNFSGALALGIVAIIPIALERYLNANQAAAIGGTSIFILVSVALETVRQAKSRLLMANYEKY